MNATERTRARASHAEFISAGLSEATQRGRIVLRGLLCLLLVIAASVFAALAFSGFAIPALKPSLSSLGWLGRISLIAIGLSTVFGVAALALLASARWLHGVRARVFFSAQGRFRTRELIYGFACMLLLGSVGLALNDFDTALAHWQSVGTPVLLLAGLICLPALLIQGGAEELLFRAYLPMWLHASFARMFVAYAVSCSVFALAHGGYGLDAFLFSLIYALAASLIVALRNGVEWAIGMHAANNWVLLVLGQTLPGSSPTAELPWTALLIDIALLSMAVGCVWLYQRRAITPWIHKNTAG